MTDHTRFQDDLKAYADGELSWPRRLAVRRHLTRCASCREEIAQMTQIAEDLRASETADALDPALRAKILGIAPDPDNPVGAPLAAPSSPPPAKLGARSRNRRALGWTLAGAALAAWFVFFPVFQHVHEYARNTESAPRFSVSVPRFQPARVASAPSPASLPPPPKQKPPTFTVRLSDREAGTGSFGGPAMSDGSVVVNGSYPGAGGGGYPGGGGGSSIAGSVAAPPAPQRQVHKEATIGVQVANPEATSDKVADMVKETGGFVAGNTLDTGTDGLKTAELTVKVPVTQFETFLGQVAHLGNVQSKNITGEDITEKASDADQTENVLEGDVQNSEARLKALGSRAKWHDEQATRDLRTQLAEARARLVLLKRMAALSTVTIDLSQTPKPQAAAPVTGGFLNGLKASTHDALGSLVSSTTASIALGIWLLAYAPLWIPALLVGRYGLREYRKRSVGT